MKNKIFLLLILFILFSPVVSRAMIVPMANITVIVNTQGGDSSFNFNLTNYPQFVIQTQNLTASKTLNVMAFTSYSLSQDVIAGLKINNILCTSSNTNDTFWYQTNNVGFSPTVNENIICTFSNTKVITKTPLLIVPGLLGTEIKEGGETLWANPTEMIASAKDDFMDPLSFSTDLSPSDSTVQSSNIIRSINSFGFIYDYTDGLINEFKNQGYVENQTLFTFPYDWRYGISGKFADGTTNVDLLAQKIKDIMVQTGSDKVDVMAHSLGGLIVKEYAMDHPADNHIGKAVFVGVPNTGAPKAAKILLQGDNFNISFPIPDVGTFGLSGAEIKKIATNMPVAYDLFPSQQYYNEKGSFIEVVNSQYPYTVNSDNNLNYSQSESFMTTDHGFNAQALTNSENLHTQDFDNFDMRTAGVDLYAIDGCRAGTLSKVVEARTTDAYGGETITYDSPGETPGDDTVPLESATNLPINQSNKYYALVSDHGKMPSEEGIRQEIVNLISGSNLNVDSSLVTQDISQCQLNGKAISVFSPVNIFVTETDQNGKGNILGLADDGSVINEISNADFEVWGEHKFIYLPQDEGQTYNINLTGTDAGIFTIKSQDISNSQISKTEVFSDLPVTTALTGQINLDQNSNTTTLSLNNSSTPILPSAILDASASEDLLPPVSVATLTGTAGQPGFYRSNISANLKATDDLSGVLAVNYNLDNTGYKKISGSVANISVSSEGQHALTFFATDKAGNNEPEKSITFAIDKTAPEAVIQFDSDAKDIKFTGTDNVSDSSLVLVQDKDDVITLTDQAGNTTVINLKDKNRKILMSTEIKSLKYNGVPADISKNDMAFLWLYDKNKNLKILSQYVMSKKDYNVLAVYDGKNTSLIGKDSSGKISKLLSGLRIIKITTNKGDLNWSY